jgi:hypothetical protein
MNRILEQAILIVELSKSVGKSITILQKVSILETLTNDE